MLPSENILLFVLKNEVYVIEGEQNKVDKCEESPHRNQLGDLWKHERDPSHT